MNEDLQHLHDLLLAQHEALYQQLDQAENADTAKAILTEMQEILHRIDLVQGLLFRQSTTALQRSLKKIDEADAKLTDAIASAKAATDFIQGVSSYLTLVDTAIDLAKTLAV